MVDPSDLRDLPPDRFGAVVAAVVARGRDGDVEVSPPSPAGAVDAVIRDGDEERLLHIRQSDWIDADVVGNVSALAAERSFDAVALVTTGPVSEEALVAAGDAGVDLVDGEAFAALVEEADVEVTPSGQPPVATIVAQLAGGWPERLREVAVELATTVDEVGEFDRELTRGSRRTDVDFLARGDGRVVVRMRFLRTCLLVYVRRDGTMESVVRLTAYRDVQPSVRALEADLVAALEDVLEE